MKKSVAHKKFSVLTLFFLVIFSTLVLAAHVITDGSSGTAIIANQNEDSSIMYNVTVNNTDTTTLANISEINITLPTGFTFTFDTNATDATGASFSNTSTLLQWLGDNIVPANTTLYFWFNATAATPGDYNISVATTNVTSTVLTNLSVTILDVTVPGTIAFATPTPTNATAAAQDYIEVNVTATDSYSLDTIMIYLYNSTNDVINSSNSSASPLYVNFSIYSDGVYYFNASVNDTQNNVNTTAYRVFTLDTTLPLIAFGDGTLADYANQTTDSIYANVSVTETNEANITFVLYNSTALVNQSIFTDGTRAVNWTTLPNEVYTYNVTIYDDAGNSNATSTQTATIDDDGPTLTFASPTPSDGSNNSLAGIAINVTATTSIDLDTITLYFYNSTLDILNTTVNATSPLFENFTGLDDGVYYFNASANDTLSTVAITSLRNITLDATDPNATFSCDQTSVNVGAAITCTCTGDDAIDASPTVSSPTSPDTDSAGSYTATCTVTDDAGNTDSESVSYTVTSSSSSSGGGGSSSGSTWTNTHVDNYAELTTIGSLSRTLEEEHRVRVLIEDTTYYVGVIDGGIASDSVTLELGTPVQEVTIDEGDTQLFDMTGDDEYDMQVTVVSISGDEVLLVIEPASGEVPDTTTGSTDTNTTTTNSTGTGGTSNSNEEDDSNLRMIIIIVIIVLLVIALGGVGWYLISQKQKKPSPQFVGH